MYMEKQLLDSGFWVQSLLGDCFLCGSKKPRNAQFPCQTAKLFRCGVCLNDGIQTYCDSLAYNWYKTYPACTKSHLKSKKKPAKIQWLDAPAGRLVPSRAPRRKQDVRSGSWGSWRCIDLSETKLLGVFLVTVGYDPVLLGHQAWCKNVACNFQSFPLKTNCISLGFSCHYNDPPEIYRFGDPCSLAILAPWMKRRNHVALGFLDAKVASFSSYHSGRKHDLGPEKVANSKGNALSLREIWVGDIFLVWPESYFR